MKLNIYLTCNLAIPLPSIYLKEMKVYVHTQIYMQIFPAPLLTITYKLETILMSIYKWMDKKEWYIHVMNKSIPLSTKKGGT